MTAEKATRRYFTVFIPAMVAYLAASLGLAWIDEIAIIPPVTLYGMTLVAVIALFFAFWAHWRLISELDEFLRMIQVKAIMVGLACILVVASGWGMLEMYTEAPVLPIFWLIPMFGSVYGIAATIITKRLGGVF